ncbi:VOC family protein [Pseudoduganella sp. GCM10020061]|uniref:VOC family protein n=1 Tax=Pseudoduganella sp. GCM10020061 TaxID=3317345 RepID=UPI003642C4B5
MATIQRIAPCLWFDDQAEQAAGFYTSVFPNSRIRQVSHYSGVGQDVHGRPEGSVMTVDFELDGTPFTALNGGPVFRFNEAVSFQVMCEDQQEVDHYWERLGEGGDPKAQMCGWLKDRFGLSWQVVPTILPQLVADYRSEGARRAFAAMMGMKKMDIAALQRAYDGR